MLRLRKLAGRRMTDEGMLIIEASVFRTQGKNREDAMRRLIELISAATIRPKARVKTRPTLSSKKKRLEGKQLRGSIKQMRKSPTSTD